MSNKPPDEIDMPQADLDVPLASANETVLRYLRFFTSTAGSRHALRIVHGDFSVMLRHDARNRSTVRLWMQAEQVNATLSSQLSDWGFEKPESVGEQVAFAWALSAASLEALAEYLVTVFWLSGAASGATIHLSLLNDAPSIKQIVGFVGTLVALVAITLYLIFARIPPFYTVFRWMDRMFAPALAGGVVFIMVGVVFLILFNLVRWIVRMLRPK